MPFFRRSHFDGKWVSSARSRLPAKRVGHNTLPNWREERPPKNTLNFLVSGAIGGGCPRIGGQLVMPCKGISSVGYPVRRTLGGEPGPRNEVAVNWGDEVKTAKGTTRRASGPGRQGLPPTRARPERTANPGLNQGHETGEGRWDVNPAVA